jgi:hypothetical protein
MIRYRRRRILLAVIVALGAVLSGALGISALDRDSEPAQGNAPMVLVLAGDDLDDFAHLMSSPTRTVSRRWMRRTR